MSRRAWTYIVIVFFGGILASLATLPLPALEVAEWETFVLLTIFATLAQLFEAESPSRQSYYPHMVFFFAGVLLLHPLLFILQILIAHIVEWIKELVDESGHLRDWYLQPFNISTHIIAGVTARYFYVTLSISGPLYLTSQNVFLAIIAAFLYVLINHAIIGNALYLARGIGWHESKILYIESLMADLVPACLGYVFAVLWQINPWLVLPALSPLALIQQALKVPMLEKEAKSDAKTGLFNAGHFFGILEKELNRAKRFSRPLSVIMADLDLLRNINNTYGHLAGDAVLIGVADIIQKEIREYDVASRFGGEEFAIVLPETSRHAAREVAERIREHVENTSFHAETTDTPISATLSLGVASFPNDATELKSLIHEADVAVYQAKLSGRNLVKTAPEAPRSARLDYTSVPQDRFHGSSTPFTPRPDSAGEKNTADDDVATAAPTPEPEETWRAPTNKPNPTGSNGILVPLFVASVVALAAGITTVGVAIGPDIVDWHIIGLFFVLAVLAELLQVNVYEDSTVSVSVVIIFATALLAGIPGVALISGAVALTHATRMKPAWYKTAFNWGTHVLAGAAAAGILSAIHLQLDAANVLLLLIPATIAAIVYYGIETGLIAVVIALSSNRHMHRVWNKQFRWLGTQYPVLCMIGLFLAIGYAELGLFGVVVFALPAFMMRYTQKLYVDRTRKSIGEMKRLNQELKSANSQIVKASETVRELNNELFLTVAKIIDARDPFTGGHALQVADYAEAIGEKLGLSEQRLKTLRRAGLLHDLGKLGIPESILYKPDALTAEEYEQMKEHARLGGDFLETSQGLNHLAPFVRHHHERWDGRGYPDGLKGDEAPIEARILAVCDAAEAMASDRPYRGALPLSDIMGELKRNAGTQFDPQIVEILLELIQDPKAHPVPNSAELVRKSNTGHLILQTA